MPQIQGQIQNRPRGETGKPLDAGFPGFPGFDFSASDFPVQESSPGEPGFERRSLAIKKPNRQQTARRIDQTVSGFPMIESQKIVTELVAVTRHSSLILQ